MREEEENEMISPYKSSLVDLPLPFRAFSCSDALVAPKLLSIIVYTYHLFLHAAEACKAALTNLCFNAIYELEQ